MLRFILFRALQTPCRYRHHKNLLKEYSAPSFISISTLATFAGVACAHSHSAYVIKVERC